jgi:hypothetical protein
MDPKLLDMLKGAGVGDIVMPRKQFIKEHKNLLKVLKSGDEELLAKEYADQMSEMKRYIKGGESRKQKDARMDYTAKMLLKIAKG